MKSACQQSRETLRTAALNIQDEFCTNQLALKQDLHHVVHGHLLQKLFMNTLLLTIWLPIT
jgi:hypothetical protein